MGQGGQVLGREGGVGHLPAALSPSQCRKNRQAINCCPALSRQCILNRATRLARAAAGDIHRYVRSLERAAKVGDVVSDSSKIEALFTICQGSCHGARVDIVEGDPPEDVFRRVAE